MTVGLAVLAAWVELAVVVGLLAWLVLRRGARDAMAEAARDLSDERDGS